MIRIPVVLTLLALAMPAVAQVPALPAAPALKSQVTVAGEIVRIGDLVENAGAAASIAVFRAPDPGTTGTVPAESVLEALRRHNVIGVDIAGVSEIKVSRASRVVSRDDIEARLSRELAGQLGLRDAKSIGLTFDREPAAVQIDANAAGELRIARLSFDRRSGRFDAQIELPGEPKRPALRVSGLASEVFEAVLLARPLARGEVLRASDLVTEKRPKSELTADIIADLQLAVGQSARRALRPGQPLRQADLMRPEIVQRNEMIVILYQVPGITLTLRGKALESGAEGEMVNVLNTQSKRTLQGVVSSAGRVTVSPPMPRLAANLSQSESGAQSR